MREEKERVQRKRKQRQTQGQQREQNVTEGVQVLGGREVSPVAKWE